MIRICFTLAIALCIFSQTPNVLVAQGKPAKRGIVKLTDEALKIHREALLIDGHNDLPWQFRETRRPLVPHASTSRKPQKKLHTDIPRLRKGGVGAQFWSAYVAAETRKKGTAVSETLEQIDVIHRMVKRTPTPSSWPTRPTTSCASARRARSPR